MVSTKAVRCATREDPGNHVQASDRQKCMSATDPLTRELREFADWMSEVHETCRVCSDTLSGAFPPHEAADHDELEVARLRELWDATDAGFTDWMQHHAASSFSSTHRLLLAGIRQHGQALGSLQEARTSPRGEDAEGAGARAEQHTKKAHALFGMATAEARSILGEMQARLDF